MKIAACDGCGRDTTSLPRMTAYHYADRDGWSGETYTCTDCIFVSVWRRIAAVVAAPLIRERSRKIRKVIADRVMLARCATEVTEWRAKEKARDYMRRAAVTTCNACVGNPERVLVPRGAIRLSCIHLKPWLRRYA